MSVMEKLNILPPIAFETQELWLNYIYNDYIPSQGDEDMKALIILSFDPVQYILWKGVKQGLFRPELSHAIVQKIKSVYGWEGTW